MRVPWIVTGRVGGVVRARVVVRRRGAGGRRRRRRRCTHQSRMRARRSRGSRTASSRHVGPQIARRQFGRCLVSGRGRVAGQPLVRHPARRARVALHRVRRPRRSAREHVQHARRGPLRRGAFTVAGPAAARAAARAARTGHPSHGVRTALAAPEPRARVRAAAEPHRAGPQGRPPRGSRPARHAARSNPGSTTSGGRVSGSAIAGHPSRSDD